jgi:hypothetical protein
MSNQSLLERAFELAESGTVEDTRALQQKLLKEGFTYRQISQIGGSALSKQLLAKITDAKSKR